MTYVDVGAQLGFSVWLRVFKVWDGMCLSIMQIEIEMAAKARLSVLVSGKRRLSACPWNLRLQSPKSQLYRPSIQDTEPDPVQPHQGRTRQA